MKEKISILIADDHPVTRAGLTVLLKAAGFKVVDEAVNGDEAVSKTLKLKPTVVLMDVRMSKKSGLEALAAIRRKLPDQRVIMLSAFTDRAAINDAVQHGASDFLVKTMPPTEIAAAIQRVCNDELLPEKSLLHVVRRLNRRSHAQSDSECPLTSREFQVMQNVALGRGNREIGEALEVSIETVKEHVQNSLRKLDVNDRTQAAVKMIQQGWA